MYYIKYLSWKLIYNMYLIIFFFRKWSYLNKKFIKTKTEAKKNPNNRKVIFKNVCVTNKGWKKNKNDEA